ncbi:MAG TPA: anti-sigma factor [Nocardioidaceae bacterium]|jgi:anti-sigma-K factor RskA
MTDQPNMSDDSNDVHGELHAYAVGALSTEEASAFERHLASCASCEQELAELYEVTAALSGSVAEEPPSSLRTAVLAEIARTPQEPPSSAVAVAEASRLGPPATPPSREESGHAERGPAESGSNVVPLRRSRATVVSGLVAAAAVVAAVVFGGVALRNSQDADDAAAQTAELTRILGADDVQTVPGDPQSAGHSGTIVLSRSEGAAVFVSSTFPGLPEDEVYEAWTIEGKQNPVSAGTFTPSGSESILSLPQASFAADVMAITVEPEGGSDQPTTDPVVTFTMPS